LVFTKKPFALLAVKKVLFGHGPCACIAERNTPRVIRVPCNPNGKYWMGSKKMLKKVMIRLGSDAQTCLEKQDYVETEKMRLFFLNTQLNFEFAFEVYWKKLFTEVGFWLDATSRREGSNHSSGKNYGTIITGFGIQI
jgi:hypothetical protein